MTSAQDRASECPQRNQTGPDEETNDDWRRMERTITAIRLVALTWGILQVQTYRNVPYPDGMRETAFALLGVAALGTVVLFEASRRHHRPQPVLCAIGLAMDAGVALGVLWLFGFDSSSAIWVILIIVALEGAARFGIGGAVATSRFFTHHVHPEDRAQVLSAIDAAVNSGEDFAFEHRILTAEGDTRYVSSRGQVTTAADGTAVALSGTAQSITGRRLHENALHHAEEKFRHAFDHAPNGMALISTGGQHLRVNRALCDITGYSEADLLATTLGALIHPDDQGGDSAGGVASLVAGTSPTIGLEARLLRPDGAVVWAQLGASPVSDGDGVHYLILQVQDISARRQADRLSGLLGDVSIEGAQERCAGPGPRSRWWCSALTPNDAIMARAAEAGVTSFVAKDSPITAMVDAIRSAAATW